LDERDLLETPFNSFQDGFPNDVVSQYAREKNNKHKNKDSNSRERFAEVISDEFVEGMKQCEEDQDRRGSWNKNDKASPKEF